MSDPVLFAVIAATAGVCLYLGWQLNNRFGSKSLEAMQKRADETIRAARRSAEKTKRKAVLESKEEILKQRNKADVVVILRNRVMINVTVDNAGSEAPAVALAQQINIAHLNSLLGG